MMPHPIGPTIRRLRQAQGLSLIALTDKAQPMGCRVIPRLELGHVQTTTFDTLVAIARALGMPLSDLIRQWEQDAAQARVARAA